MQMFEQPMKKRKQYHVSEPIKQECIKNEKQEDLEFKKLFEKPKATVKYGTLTKQILLSKLRTPYRLIGDIDSRLRNELGTYFNKEDQNSTPIERIINAAKRDIDSEEQTNDSTNLPIAEPFAKYVSMKIALENTYSTDSTKNQYANRDFNLFSLYVASVEAINGFNLDDNSFISPSERGVNLPEIDFNKSTRDTLDSILNMYSSFVKTNNANNTDLNRKTQYFFKGILDQVIQEDKKQNAGISFEALDAGYSTIFGISYNTLKTRTWKSKFMEGEQKW